MTKKRKLFLVEPPNFEAHIEALEEVATQFPNLALGLEAGVYESRRTVFGVTYEGLPPEVDEAFDDPDILTRYGYRPGARRDD